MVVLQLSLTNMDTNPTPKMAPIYRLNCDILMQIFQTNNMFMNSQSPVLTQAYCALQVCCEWCSLMFHMPELWAHMLDMDHLWHMNVPQEWINELLRRTGSTALWIKSTCGPWPDPDRHWPVHITCFLFCILANNWHRVQILILNVKDIEWGLQNKSLWSWMCTPMPLL